MEQNQSGMRHLYRSATNRVIVGVCGGLGEYFNIDPLIFRIIFLALLFGGGAGFLIYIILAFAMPKDSAETIQKSAGKTGIDLEKKIEGLAEEVGKSGGVLRNSWLGWIIVGLGVFLFLGQVFPSRFFSWDLIWPAAIILCGLLIVSRGKINPWSNKKGDQKAIETKPVDTKGHKMDLGALLFGLLFVVVGLAFLAQNMGWVAGINFDHLFRFWPIFIVLAGLSIISRGTKAGATIATWIVFIMMVLLAVSLFLPSKPIETKDYNFDIPKSAAATSTEVSIKSGAAEVEITGGATNLATGTLTSNFTELKTESKVESNIQKISIASISSAHSFRGEWENQLSVKLAENIPMVLNLDSGASSLDVDLSKINLNNLNINSGASQLDLILGDKANTSNIKINAGASSITVDLPKTAGIKVSLKGGLVSKNFPDDLRQIDKNNFESANYTTATKKINLEFDAGVSNISLNWRS